MKRKEREFIVFHNGLLPFPELLVRSISEFRQRYGMEPASVVVRKCNGKAAERVLSGMGIPVECQNGCLATEVWLEITREEEEQ